MLKNTCSLCSKPVHARGLCKKHYLAQYYRLKKDVKTISEFSPEYYESQSDLVGYELNIPGIDRINIAAATDKGE
ncbi:hypothetical protein WIB65_12150 [Citrobacter freundii]|uniref:hypothetical protein n=1 Tax=Citrobacter freundii TaxID=546 RepID=UPI00339C233B